MKTKHKRLVIICCGVLLGPIFAVSALLAPGISSLSLSDSKLLIPFYPLFWVSLWSCEISRYVERISGIIPSSNACAYALLIIPQFVFYSILGLIIACIVYPPWKAKDKIPTAKD
jgi:hypothetical protein